LVSQPSSRQPRRGNGQVNDVIEIPGGTGANSARRLPSSSRIAALLTSMRSTIAAAATADQPEPDRRNTDPPPSPKFPIYATPAPASTGLELTAGVQHQASDDWSFEFCRRAECIAEPDRKAGLHDSMHDPQPGTSAGT
jgi:hypothetical protein